MQSERFRLRVVAPVLIALVFSLLTSATPATQSRRNHKSPQAQAPAAKQQPLANDKKQKNAAPDEEPGGELPEGKQPEAKPTDNNQSPKPDPCETTDPKKDGTAGQRIKLFYTRDAAKIVEILDAIAKQKNSDLHCLIVKPASQDEVILYGPEEKRAYARRVIAALDLPRPGIDMHMWGVQISSRNPDKMAQVMPEIREEINRTQQAVRETYTRMQHLARGIQYLNEDFRLLIEEKKNLGYTSALDASRPLSLTDILLRMVAANDPSQAAHDMGDELRKSYRESAVILKKAHEQALVRIKATNKPKKSTKPVVVQDPESERHPFENFLRTRGLYYDDGDKLVDKHKSVTGSAFQARGALLDFGLNYARLVHEPRCFSSYRLQQSAEILNSRLQTAVDALNLDIQNLFVEPALRRLQEIVRNFDDVEYAQVGKTSVASLSGIPTEVTSHSVSAFDVTPPLRLSELLTKAKDLADKTNPFIPTETKPGAAAATELTAGSLPISQIVGLIAALGEERSVWRELQAGISLTITPNVLRNMTSAELKVDLKTGDPQGTKEEGVRPLSRVTQHDVKTSVYVNALDFFDLSAFISQSSLDGGRGYVPVIGPVWRGLFSDVPGIGNLFSWRKGPQTVYQQSLVLTNSFITPTAMGIALLFPTDSSDDFKTCDEKKYEAMVNEIKAYKKDLQNRLAQPQNRAAK